ncbi:MAG TPA: N-acetylneuraminate synthase [Burkholderiales bacterium]|nr:N-acetylneuraminate synthase [Burkholderiales bacterium]
MGSAPVLIIAEAGVNHNGDMAIARKLVEMAASAGCDFVKFQTFSADRLVTKTARKAEYQSAGTGNAESQYEMLRKLELTPAMHGELVAHCAAHSIRFLSTGFDIESVDLLDGLGVDIFKVPSGEITNVPYLRHLGALGKRVILSTGMSCMAEIELALQTLENAGTPRARITVLHCNTEYPTPMQDVNLRAMCAIRDAFRVQVGYSDHTLGIEVPVAAVALGASIIEKHFTVDRTLPGPDHAASLEAAELRKLVSTIRNIELALGDGIKRASPSEIKNLGVARKSIVAAVAIRAGERFSEKNLTVKRPGSGISPVHWDAFIGRVATRAYAADDLIEW